MAPKRTGGACDKFKMIKEKWVVQGKLLIFCGELEIHLSLVVLLELADVLPLVLGSYS